MAVQEKLYTLEEFLEIANLPENENKWLELDEGVIVEMPPSSQKNTVTASRIAYFLNAYVIPSNIGYVSGPDGGYLLAPKTMRQPDIAFISKQRHPTLEGVVFPVAPDLAVEVVSPNEDVFKKIQQYIAAGTLMVWTFYTDNQTVSVWQRNQDGSLRVDTLDINGTLDGGDVLPGFTLPVRDIFPQDK
jgi:Uma2 family endonuclease